jgi:hypothetical protein
MNTKRAFNIVFNSGGDQLEIKTLLLCQLPLMIKDSECEEVFYALNEELDNLMDLQIGRTMYFQPNRDDKTSKGIIIRTH